MQKPSLPIDEKERQQELERLEILDTETEQSFDDLTILASQICETHISLISLLDNDRQWFKSRTGLNAQETGRDISWCGHAILGNDIFEVYDSALDERFSDNPLFLGEPTVRFYAGMPLVTNNGYKIGTLCVIDKVPKKLSDWQKEVLRKLAKQVVILIESRLREKELIKTNARLDSIVKNIPVMLGEFGQNGEIEWTNRKWIDELGWDLKDFKGGGIFEKIFPDRDTQLKVRKFLQSESSEWKDFCLTNRNGHSFYTSWSTVRLANHGYLCIGQNIHERKSIESLSQDVQRLTKVGGWELDVMTGEVKWTAETFRIYGLPEGEGVNLDAAIACYAAHDQERISACVKAGIEQGQPWNEEFQFIDAKGNHKWVRAIGEPVYNEDKKLFKLKGTFQDITEIKKLQFKLDSENKISSHQAKLAAIGQLASGVAHEVNNPLAIIEGYVAVIKSSISLDEETVLRLNRINIAVERIKTIVGALKNFSRSDTDQVRFFKIREVIQESIGLVSKIYLKENISIIMEGFQAEDSILLGNRGRLSQVIINLLANAKDATANMLDRKIYVSILNEKNYSVIKVRDNGKGIDESIRDKIFDPFFSTKPIHEGTGIGLSIVNSIIKEHDGHISFETYLNQGTTFTIMLPNVDLNHGKLTGVNVVKD
jgi:PAS domain S-box-containing protein